eukprot:915052-Prymnesium_polylepis.1
MPASAPNVPSPRTNMLQTSQTRPNMHAMGRLDTCNEHGDPPSARNTPGRAAGERVEVARREDQYFQTERGEPLQASNFRVRLVHPAQPGHSPTQTTSPRRLPIPLTGLLIDLVASLEVDDNEVL